jgi:two-component sensor histidine kinase
MATSLNLQVSCRPESLRDVRDAVDTLDTLDQRTLDAVKLVTNELVSNSVGHSGMSPDDYIEVTVARQRACVRIDVHDQGTGFTLPDGQRNGGRGLAIVQALSTLVGISHDGHTHAWAEVSLPSAASIDGPRPSAA